MFRRCSRPVGEQRGLRCRVLPRCRILWGMGRRRKCSWFCLGTPHGSWRWAVFPCQHQCLRPASVWVEIPEYSHSSPPLSSPHPKLSRLTRLPLCSAPLPSCYPLRFVLCYKHQIIKRIQVESNTVSIMKRTRKLTEHEVVWSEDLSEWAWSDGVHGAWLQINENATRYIFPT